jgi:hypothetical protein
MKWHYGQKVLAAYRPKRTDDLRYGLDALIGEIAVWYVSFFQDSEGNPYKGQQTFQTMDKRWDGYWVPECDLEIVRVL